MVVDLGDKYATRKRKTQEIGILVRMVSLLICLQRKCHDSSSFATKTLSFNTNSPFTTSRKHCIVRSWSWSYAVHGKEDARDQCPSELSAGDQLETPKDTEIAIFEFGDGRQRGEKDWFTLNLWGLKIEREIGIDDQ
ncbi:hypothetical protein ACLOJK_015680 [Asimina triloba]